VEGSNDSWLKKALSNKWHIFALGYCIVMRFQIVIRWFKNVDLLHPYMGFL